MLTGTTPTKAAIVQQPQPIAKSGDADVLEAGVCQPREQIRVDRICAKNILVFPEAETAKPFPHIHGVAPHIYKIIAQSHHGVQRPRLGRPFSFDGHGGGHR